MADLDRRAIAALRKWVPGRLRWSAFHDYGCEERVLVERSHHAIVINFTRRGFRLEYEDDHVVQRHQKYDGARWRDELVRDAVMRLEMLLLGAARKVSHGEA